MKNNFLLLHMKRGGGHAISAWLKELTGLKFYNNVIFGWKKKELRTVHNKVRAKQPSISTIEDFDYNDWKRFDFSSFPYVQNSIVITIIRSPENWLASSYQRKWWTRSDHREYYVYLNQEFENERAEKKDSRIGIYKRLKASKDKHYHINYDDWFVSEEYRKKICKDLGVEWDPEKDKIKKNMAINSSFDKMKKGNAEQLNVLTRYKEFMDDGEFKMLLRELLK